MKKNEKNVKHHKSGAENIKKWIIIEKNINYTNKDSPKLI